jgi:hypothetical protein
MEKEILTNDNQLLTEEEYARFSDGMFLGVPITTWLEIKSEVEKNMDYQTFELLHICCKANQKLRAELATLKKIKDLAKELEK